MAVLGSDNFNRADNASLGSDWVEQDGVWEIDTNRLQISAIGSDIPYAAKYDLVSQLDVKVSVTHVAASTADGGPIARWDGGNLIEGSSGVGRAYVFEMWSTNSFAVNRYENGAVPITLGSGTFTRVANGVMRLEVEGSGATITVRTYYNGALVASYSDTHANRITTAGKTGVASWVVSATPGGQGDYDNFLVEDIDPYQILLDTSWTVTTSPRTSPSFNVVAGDLLVVAVVAEEPVASAPSTPVASAGSVTWTYQGNVNVSGYGRLDVWTGAVGVSASITITVTNTQAATDGSWWNGIIHHWKSAVVGAFAITNATGAPSLSITTTQANGKISVFNIDRNALSGVSRAWRVTAGDFSELLYTNPGSDYAVYAGYHQDAGTVGAYDVGLTAPAGQAFSIAAVEANSGGTPPVSSPGGSERFAATQRMAA